MHAKSRRQAGKARLRWRVSNPKARGYSLGWVPFKSRALTLRDGKVVFAGHGFDVWDSYGLSSFFFRAGAFVEDRRGRWYLAVQVAVERKDVDVSDLQPVANDPGLKDVAMATTGDRCPSRRYCELEAKIGLAQRAGQSDRVRALHAKVANRRKDDAHKFSRAVVNAASTVYIGAWTPPACGKSRWAKSARDGALASLKGMLRYKCEHAGISFPEVDEANSNRTCSACGHVHGNLKGAAGLGVRWWVCECCGVGHDRDFNAAVNILIAGVGHHPQ